MTYDLRTASSKKPLYGHDSPQNAFVVEDYPSGFRARCRKRVWLEYKAKTGWRLVEQTSVPWYPGEEPAKDAELRWNKPKASTYAPIAACMYLDAQDYVQWDALSGYSKPETCAAFMKDFPQADFGGIKSLALAAINHAYKKLHGAIVMTINGEPKPWNEGELGEARKDLGAWLEIAKDAKLTLKADFLAEAKDLVDGKTPAKIINVDEFKAEQKQKEENEKAKAEEIAKNTKGALTIGEFVEMLNKKIDAKDRILKIKGDDSGSMRSGQVFVQLYNVPQSENKGPNADNNRFMWVIEGFDRKNPDVKAVKVKLEERLNGAPFADRAKYKLRGMSGTPEKVADTLARHIHKVVAEVEPKLSKYASYDCR